MTKLKHMLPLIAEDEYVAIKFGTQTFVLRGASNDVPYSWLDLPIKRISTNGSWDIQIELR